MLVLTRKPGEGFVIGDDITIKIVEMKGGGVRIGIEAPQDKKSTGRRSMTASPWKTVPRHSGI